MDELFGAPMSAVALVLAVLFGLSLLVLLYILLRNPVLVRMAVRNVPRRRAQSLLIVAGMMLATAIISSAFTTGDSVNRSIERDATEDLLFLDQVVRLDDDSPKWETEAMPDSFAYRVFEEMEPDLRGDPDVDGVLPAYVERVPVANIDSQQFEVQGLLTGVDPGRTGGFGTLRDQAGQPIDLAGMGPNDVVIDYKGAAEIDAIPGHRLGVALGPGALESFTVRAVADGWYFRTGEVKLVLMMPLGRVQELLGREGEINRVLVSNRGGVSDGEPLTEGIQERLANLSVIKGNGLELFPLKSEIIDFANEIASIFVTIFTTFGLFSIGVGILLIFLIFSMLAAERKSEMGMARGIGMQRSHLVQMFIAEGSVYSLVSAFVGSVVGVLVGFLLVTGVASAIARADDGDFALTAAVTPRSVLVAFLVGSVVTFVTVAFAAWRTSRLNIVRAIRDIPEPQLARAGRRTLIWGVVLTIIGVVVTIAGFNSGQQTTFGIGVSLMPIGVAMVLRWKGFSQRLVVSAVGVILLVFWLLPQSVFDKLREEWFADLSIFFVSGALVVAGAVLLVMNNPGPLVAGLTNTIGRARALTPVLKSAVSYPLRATFRTGLSVAMFAVVVFSIVVMSTLNAGFDQLFDDQDRLAGGYGVIAFARADLNPIDDLGAAVEANPELDFVAQVDGQPSVGAMRTVFQASAKLSEQRNSRFLDTNVSGVDDDFVESNSYRIVLATEEFGSENRFDGRRIWKALSDNPGLAVISELLVPSRNAFGFDVEGEDFRLNVEGLYVENDNMDPVPVTVRDQESGEEFELTVIGVVDDFSFFLPPGLFTSSRTFDRELRREVNATSFYFNIEPGAEDPSRKIETAFFTSGMDTRDIEETLEDVRAARTAFNNLLTGFMALGLVVGTAALGVISARAVVERRHQIGMLRAIGFSRRMVQGSFLMESTFIAVLGIALGIGLGLITSVNVMDSIQKDEPDIRLIIPWTRLAIIGVGAYLFSLLTTYLPARSAAGVAPADALRYE